MTGVYALSPPRLSPLTTMVNEESLTVKDAVHKLQLSLLEGIQHETLLSAAGSLLCQSDYQDVVTERTIAKMCGYPLCTSSLPSERPRKGHYHVSLKEHRVYDLQETYMYCSTTCLINSRAFSLSLQEERISTLNPLKIDEILKLFEGLGSDDATDINGFSKLKIVEKTGIECGEVSAGPSNAIEGYVPQKDRELKRENSVDEGARREQQGSKSTDSQPYIQNILSDYMNFTSTIITQDDYSISKTVPQVKADKSKGKLSYKEVNNQKKPTQKPAAPLVTKNINGNKNGTTTNSNVKVLEESPEASENCRNVTSKPKFKSSLKTSDSNKAAQTVTWADEKTNGKDLCEFSELEDQEVSENSYRFKSAEACARALTQAAEAVESGKSDVSDAVSEADIIILPPNHATDEANYYQENDDASVLKWPTKPGFSEAELFDSEDSLYDSPPEGFNLTLSPFSTMFMALFAWISSSTLAYIYGKDDSFCEAYSSVNGREYPLKIVLSDGRSSEIRLTLASSLSRALPGIVNEMKLPTPISTLEQGMGRLIDTMSFIDPLPAFRMKQWQVIILLFLDALSVTRIPALTPYIISRRVLLPKVLEGAQISVEEYEIMKDLIIPLGRVPQLSTQSGG